MPDDIAPTTPTIEALAEQTVQRVREMMDERTQLTQSAINELAEATARRVEKHITERTQLAMRELESRFLVALQLIEHRVQRLEDRQP
jgi:hypothetical protein